jgi:hypothetical protein
MDCARRREDHRRAALVAKTTGGALMAGTVKERDPWRVTVAVYLFDKDIILRCVVIDSRTQEFELDIPELDWAQIKSDYQAGTCCLADARAFVTAWHAVLRVMKTAKENGSYCSPAWINGKG